MHCPVRRPILGWTVAAGTFHLGTFYRTVHLSWLGVGRIRRSLSRMRGTFERLPRSARRIHASVSLRDTCRGLRFNIRFLSGSEQLATRTGIRHPDVERVRFRETPGVYT